ncbi:TPA: hypothetical protein N0F65_008297 [Lagenidium giganteum]|uniref:SEC7 domain-containing protein n=1 Tax=Lagenidium giganteum TaxID=4803 RepID=A0AAV2YSB1_9STRA|nr:TPA: hypothetical protein N0F65_008297 [Lagenidium giganteum]
MVGKVLGEPDELSLSILQEYANAFTFKDFPFDVALRVYLGRFVLPGEAQKIDRILQAFAKAYFAANPKDPTCTSEDAVYMLAFSIVLLNTDAHNPHLAKRFKMRKEDFIRNHQRLVVNGEKIPSEPLGQLYDSFATYPIQPIAPKPQRRPTDEVELVFADDSLGLEIETSIDGQTCLVKRFRPPPTVQWGNQKQCILTGWVIVAVDYDCTSMLPYSLTRYLLKTAPRPMSVRFCEPSIYFASLS